MERDKNKLPAKRAGIKAKPLHVSDFIALGSKSTRGQGEVSEQKTKSKSISSGSSTERKEVASVSSSLSLPAKKPKISSSTSSSQFSRTSSQTKKEIKSNQWDAVAIETDANDFVLKVLEAEDCSDDERVEALLCGAVKKLKAARAKPDNLLCLGLLYLAKTRPFLFCSELTVEAFCSLLKRDISVNFKTKGNNLVSVLAANVLMAAYRDESSWPENFVKVYIEDSLGERVWVDHEQCKGFVDNILTAFKTKQIPKSMMLPERIFKPEACPSPPAFGTDDDESCSSITLEFQEYQENISIFSRYLYSEESLAHHVLEVIREHMLRRQPMEISRNTLRFLVSTCGLSEVRLIVAQKLEMWLQNPKLTRPAQELLLAICLNCNQHNQHDVEVISLLIKIRIKAKPIINHYLQCMKELLGQHLENLSTLLKNAIYNELSNSRNPNNMQLLSIIFQHSPDKSAKVLANVFLELLMNKDDYLRALRALLREIARTVRHDLNFVVFCSELLQEKRDATFVDLEMPLKERMFLSLTDLIVLAIFLSVNPAVKEQFSAYSRGEKKDFTQLRNYQMQVAKIQSEAVWWLYTVASKMYKPGRNEFIHGIHKILFMEQIEHYYSKDNWPTEGERILLLRLASEVPLFEETLMRVMYIGLSREHPLNAPDALELADQLVKRAAVTYNEEYAVLDFQNTELCDLIFDLCAYHHPENISLPQGYHPPNLAISELYWKAWMMLLVICAHNPSTFGETAWKTYPMLKYMMEMCITNQFSFPSPTLAVGENAEEIKNREIQMSQMEKDQILLFETHLAAASTKVAITEANSLLLSKLISRDPHGRVRKPPAQIFEQLKSLNVKLKLGDLLCRSRNPDFLLDIIQRQGTSQSMPWLSELVESSVGSFNMLPVQCLCEFLMSEMSNTSVASDSDDNKDEKSIIKKRKKQELLLTHLQKLLHEPDNSVGDTIEIITYFMQKLRSQQATSRNLASKSLQIVVMQPDEFVSDDDDILQKDPTDKSKWLLEKLPLLPHFDAVRPQACLCLRQACQIENDPTTIAAYVTFLATDTPEHNLLELSDLALDMAQMIVERPTIVNTILPTEGGCNKYGDNFLTSISEIFFKYLNKAKRPSKETYSWCESQDQILIQWASGETATMHILVVHAMIIVLTYGPPHSSSRFFFDELLETWFPRNSEQPKAFLVDTSEECLLLPDWLKLRMIRSSVDILVDAALKDLDASQLVLFIQSFGISVSSMSKLLKNLDLAVEYDSLAVEQAVIDKSYMSQLVEVQHRRGAVGGEKFAKLLVDTSSTEMSMDVSTVPAQTRVIQRAPAKLPTAVSIESISISLLKLFGLDTSEGILSAKQEHELFKGLQKALSQDILNRSSEYGAISKFVETCQQILSSDLNVIFFQSLHRKLSYSSVLLRLATASQAHANIQINRVAQNLVWICHQIMQFSKGVKSSLLTVASQFFNKFNPKGNKKIVPWKQFIKQSKCEQLSSENIMQIVRMAETHDAMRMEEVIQFLVKCTIANSNTKPLMSAMTNITLKRLTHSAALTANVKNFNRSKFCFFVDWLECLEPKIVSSFPKSQCQLLFSLIIIQNKPVFIPFRPYLLALLIHQSSWDTLHYYINIVLDPKSSAFAFDPSSVLDFLHACIYIPKIWQGKYSMKRERRIEDVLALSTNQIQTVVDYILEEAALKQSLENVGCGNVESIDNGDMSNVYPVIDTRLHLLTKCLAHRSPLMKASIDHLVSVILEKDSKYQLGCELLLQLYLRIPSILSHVPDNVLFLNETAVSQKSNDSRMDVISHTLLTSLARTDASKQCIEKMTNIEFICRKMASTHPVLLLRQLPMVSTLLRGRNHFEFSVFRVRNHLTLFTCFLGLLELLPPYVFRTEYCSHLNDILSLFMEVFQTYGPQKELVQLLNRFFVFLLQYLVAKPTVARQFIMPYSDMLQELSAAYPDLVSLRSLLAGTCLHYWGAPGASTSTTESKIETPIPEVFAASQVHLTQSPTHIARLCEKLSQGSVEDVSSALQELETTSFKKPMILEPVLDNLKDLMQETNASFRTSAFNLIMRYLKSNPKYGSHFVSSYLQCLESEQRDVMLTALEHLPEFVVLVQEQANVLLQKVFNIGMLMNINTAPQIRETISLLIMQSGC